MLKLVVGEAAEVVTASQRVDVGKLLNTGYKFKFDNLTDALRGLLK
jgi:NAD dependent epimerase/dehydratase family enzyme